MPQFAKKKWQVSEKCIFCLKNAFFVWKMHFSAPLHWHKIRFEYQRIIFNEKSKKIHKCLRTPPPYGQPDRKFPVLRTSLSYKVNSPSQWDAWVQVLSPILVLTLALRQLWPLISTAKRCSCLQRFPTHPIQPNPTYGIELEKYVKVATLQCNKTFFSENTFAGNCYG